MAKASRMEYQHHITAVRRALSDYIDSAAKAGVTQLYPWLAADAIARKLGRTEYDRHHATAGTRLQGQVEREMRAASAETVTTAVAGGYPLVRSPMPHGRGTRYIPTGHAAKRATEADIADAKRRQVGEQWMRINEALADAGYVTFGQADREPNLSLATWMRLAEQVTGLDLGSTDRPDPQHDVVTQQHNINVARRQR